MTVDSSIIVAIDYMDTAADVFRLYSAPPGLALELASVASKHPDVMSVEINYADGKVRRVVEGQYHDEVTGEMKEASIPPF